MQHLQCRPVIQVPQSLCFIENNAESLPLADTLQKAIMDYMSEAEAQDNQKKLDDFTRKAGETITEAMGRFQALMEKKISHDYGPDWWPMFREDKTITALKRVVSPSTRQRITRTETWANMMGVRFPADSCIRLAEKHENSLTLGQRGANGGHPDKLQAPNVSQTETTRMIPESPKETKESLSGTDP